MGKYGAVAHLGERFNGIEEVRSSILLSSTILNRLSNCPPLRKVSMLVRDANLISVMIKCVRKLTLLLVMAYSTSALYAGPAPASKDVSSTNGPDVVLLVMPSADLSTRIGLAFNKRIPHTNVREAVKKLTQISGWSFANDLVIVDESLKPSRTSEYPITTTAMFTLLNAPQAINFSPVLTPYIRAFQNYNRMEILFHLPEMIPYKGPEHVENEFYNILLSKSQGVYRFEVEIKKHNELLPNPDEFVRVPQPVSAPASSVDNKPAPSSMPNVPLILVVVGALITGGVGTYILYSKRAVTIHER